MATAQSVVLMGVKDCQFTPSGGSAVDILGIRRLEIVLDGNAIAAEGDDTTLAYLSFTKGANITFEGAGISLGALAALTGGSVDTSTPGQVTLSVSGGVAPNGTLKGTAEILKVPAGVTGNTPKTVEFEIPNFYVLSNQLRITLGFEEVAIISGGGYASPDSTGTIVKITFKE